MKKILSVIMALFCMVSVSGCQNAAETENNEAYNETEKSIVHETQNSEDTSLPDSGKTIENSVVFIYGADSVWIKGEEHSLEIPPFLDGDTLFIPVAAASVILGGSFIQSGDVYYLNIGGNVSVMMEDYNVILVNSTAYVMKCTPQVKDGVFCLPAEGLAKALSMNISKYPAEEICVFENLSERLSNEMLCSVRKTLGFDLLEISDNEEIRLLAESCGEDYTKIERLAVEEKLWISDENGIPSSVTIGDGGRIILKEYVINTVFPENSVFVLKNNSLCDIKSGKEISEPPDILYTKELKAATGRYMELKAAFNIMGDSTAGELLDAYFDAICVSLSNEKYIDDMKLPYETGLYSEKNMQNGWDDIFNKASVGDFLVFSADGAGPEYGFFNHSALIIEKNENEKTLHLLQARGAEYGVGADLEMDHLSKDSFEEIDYYRSYGTVFLCRAGTLTETEASKMVKDAYEKYNGYQFGYGGRMGLEETNCTELIDESYLSAGIDIIDGDYDSRLKEVLKGNTKNLVLIPDDLLFSDKTEVIAVWKR